MAQYCCSLLDLFFTMSDMPMYYDAKKRKYDLSIPRMYLKKELVMGYAIEHCYFCGKAFPLDLSAVWRKVVEKKFGKIDIFDSESMKKLPEEFLTDAWWKNGDYEKRYRHLIMTTRESIVKELKKHNITPKFDQGEFCCFGMNRLVHTDYRSCPVQYIPHRRHYLITVPDYYVRRKKKPSVYTLFYCPRCGAKLPDDLSSLWYTIVKKKFGSPLNAPAEFLTDRWWKDGNV